MSIDYLGAKKQKEHENEQDEKIASGGSGGDFVPVITTDQFVMDQTTGGFPVPVVDEIKEAGKYIIILNATNILPIPSKIVYNLDVMGDGQSNVSQLLSMNLFSVFLFLTRDFRNNAWGQWELKNVDYAFNLLNQLNGYDDTKTQVLKNVNGVLTWVDEA